MFWSIVIGITAGFLAGKIMRGKGFGLLVNLVVGVIGSFAGGYIFKLIGLSAQGLTGELLMSTVGAIAFLAILRVLK